MGEVSIEKERLYEGKCKKIFAVPDQENQVRMEFKDALTAYNGKKKSSFKGKGRLNRDTSSLIFRYLKTCGVDSHWIQDEGSSGMIVYKMIMIPLEVVVRNRLAGSTAKKFQRLEGGSLDGPLFELYYKDESLGDPFISEDQALMLGALSSLEEGCEIREQALEINRHLLGLFSRSGMDLIDFKLEFGRYEGRVLLGDEISADSCRIWLAGRKERLDKDRFRLDLGGVQEGYQRIYESLQRGFSVD